MKRSDENKEYKVQRVQYLLDHSLCKAHLKGCMFRASQIHHKAGRIGDLLLDVSYWLPVCAQCHEFIERNPEISKELGFSINRLNN